jgi:V-type H+-transporting ATPase subunit A
MERAMKSITIEDTEQESRFGSVFSVSGPVVVAENMIGVCMFELVFKNVIRSGLVIMNSLAR